jgi:SAM-dependent methyltransferase
METKLIYRNIALYDLIMRLLYRRSYFARHEMVADFIPRGASVLDLCCGSALLYRGYLNRKSVKYLGLDSSPFFVEALNKRGIPALVWDLRSEKPLPRADYVVLQGGLLFFLPDPTAFIQRMLAAAENQVIIMEPIRNLSTSRFPLLAKVATRLSGGGEDDAPSRFNEETLDRVFENLPVKQKFKIPSGRDKVYVLENRLTSADKS